MRSKAQTHRTGGMSRRVQHFKGHSCQSQLIAFTVKIGVVQSTGGHRMGELQVFFAQKHPAIGIRCQILHGTYMVKMSVGQQNGLQSQALILQKGQHPPGFVTGIDDQTPVSFAENITVGPKHPKGDRRNLHSISFKFQSIALSMIQKRLCYRLGVSIS